MEIILDIAESLMYHFRPREPFRDKGLLKQCQVCISALIQRNTIVEGHIHKAVIITVCCILVILCKHLNMS